MSLVSDRNTLFQKQDNQREDEQNTWWGRGCLYVEFWGFLPCVEDTANRMSSEKLTTQNSGSHRSKNSCTCLEQLCCPLCTVASIGLEASEVTYL